MHYSTLAGLKVKVMLKVIQGYMSIVGYSLLIAYKFNVEILINKVSKTQDSALNNSVTSTLIFRNLKYMLASILLKTAIIPNQK